MGEPASGVLERGLYARHQQATLVTTGRRDAVLASRHLQNAYGI
jgi:hypothetical protein